MDQFSQVLKKQTSLEESRKTKEDFRQKFKSDFSIKRSLELPKPLSSSFSENNSQHHHLVFNCYNHTEIDTSNIMDKRRGIHYLFGNFKDFYEEGKLLGQGTSSVVKKAVCKRTGNQFAIKTTKTRDAERISTIKQEYLNLKRLRHPNIVGVHELYIDKKLGEVIMIMDLQEEKQMSKLLAKKGKFDEIVARKLFYKLADAINYLHSKGISHREISHRDIKPENILCSEDGEVLKLIDFNCAKFTNEDHTHQNLEMLTVTGTHFYQAPEIIRGELYCKQVDIWSAGVTLYQMLSGELPFFSEYLSELLKQIISGQFSFHQPCWQTISPLAQDIITQCLEIKPMIRNTAYQLLNHQWLKNCNSVKNTNQQGDAIRLDHNQNQIAADHESCEIQSISSQVVACLQPRDSWVSYHPSCFKSLSTMHQQQLHKNI